MRKFRPMIVPAKAHPLVRKLFVEMNHQQIGMLDLAERSGINKNTINDWKRRSAPQVHNLGACFGVLGLELTVKRTQDDKHC